MGKVSEFLSSKVDYLLKYPNISKCVSTFFGLIEVTILESLRIIDKYFSKGFYESTMNQFNRIYSSRVIPLNINLNSIPYISPTEELISIINRIPSLAIGYCYCRSKYSYCNNNLWTCIHIGTAKSLTELSKKIPLKSVKSKEVEQLLYKADRDGLLHQLITTPSPEYFYVICNCCPCCCVMLQSAIRRKNPNVALASNFIARTYHNKCINCGKCVKRCYFGARILKNGKMKFKETLCKGCGLCARSCEQNAIIMIRRVLKQREFQVMPE